MPCIDLLLRSSTVLAPLNLVPKHGVNQLLTREKERFLKGCKGFLHFFLLPCFHGIGTLAPLVCLRDQYNFGFSRDPKHILALASFVLEAFFCLVLFCFVLDLHMIIKRDS